MTGRVITVADNFWNNMGAPLNERLLMALEKAGRTLERHLRKYG